MIRLFKVGLPCILQAASAPALWSIITTHDDVFDSQNLLQADAAELKTTYVSPHLKAHGITSQVLHEPVYRPPVFAWPPGG